MKLTIEPLWAGFATFVAYLYTVWAMQHLYADMSSGNGTGIMVFYIISLFVFPIILGMASLLMAVALRWSENVVHRAILIAACTTMFFVLHGALGPIALLIGAAIAGYVYVQTKRKREDDEELKRFQ